MHSNAMRPYRALVWLAVVLVPSAGTFAQDTKPKAPAQPAEPALADDKTLQDLIAAHNKVRAEEKLPPLTANARLTEAARRHARDMAEHQEMTHKGSDGSDAAQRIKRTRYQYQEIGENVAEGSPFVEDAMRSWIESPPHRKAILGPFTEIGGAVAKGPDGRSYWSVEFGRPMPPVDPAKSPGELIAALNRARAQARKRPLRADAQLARVAARFARDSADRKSLEVQDRNGTSPFDVLKQEGNRSRRFGEELASGEGDPQKVLDGWLKEKEDREALLSSYDRVGVGVATDADGVPYWVLLLAQGARR
jgi:uncharacterized protein YkwD